MVNPKSHNDWIFGDKLEVLQSDLSGDIAFDDDKIAFMIRHASGKRVLDLGCVHHNPENYQSKYWLHKALRSVATHLEGLDIYPDGVEYLRKRGFNIALGDAQAFALGRTFDVIVAGDLIEHLENFAGFLNSCKAHLAARGKLLISTPNPWYWKNVIKACVLGRVANNPEHTCWLCPQTLQQLVARHGMRVTEVVFGSRYLRDRLAPLPKGIRHTTFHAVVMLGR
jgi:2-polyprenyl-3-methyl-5-hydroxy-6-metoxy-1,4-benzoquinol methylase